MAVRSSPYQLPTAKFDRNHWFNRQAVLLYNANELRNQAWARTAPTAPTFDSSAVFYSRDGFGRHSRKGTADDGKGVNFGSDTPQHIGTGTWVFLFSVDSIGVYTNLWCNSRAGSAVGLLWRINNAGKFNMVHINTLDLYTGAIVLAANRVHCIAVSYTNSTGVGQVCVDGVFDTAIAASGAPRSFTYDTVRLQSGGVTSFDGANRMWLAGMSPVVYTGARLKSLSTDPFQLLEKTPYSAYKVPAAAAAGGPFPFFTRRIHTGGMISMGTG